jgi:PAS domain S-box-containing protein
MISLRRKLPLLISALLVATVTTVCVLAYRKVEGVLLATTRERLTLATQQVAGMLGESVVRLRRDAQARAANADVIAFAAGPSATTSEAARRFLDDDASHASQTVAFELWAPDGRRLLGAGAPSLLAARENLAPANTAPAPRDIGPMSWTSNEGVVYTVTAPVLDAGRDTVAWLAAVRSLSSAQGVNHIGELIGSRATLWIGNTTGDAWSDFQRPVAGPPRAFPVGAPAEFSDGTERLGVMARVDGTPWMVFVHSPRSDAVAPARSFVLHIAGIAIALVMIGAIGAWHVSHQVTGPLAEVTQAARDLARGDYSRRVKVARRDELGSLGDSFNTMAEQVEASTHHLHRHAEVLRSTNLELRESEERYRRLADAAHEGICVVDPAGVITYANGRLAGLLGYTVEELRGRSIFDLMDRATAFAARTRFARRLRGIAETEEVPFQRRDGSTLWAAEAVSSLFDDDGTFSGALMMLSDVTDARAAREELARSERQFRAVTENASDMVCLLDATGRRRYVSPAHERFIGYTPADLEGGLAFDEIHPEDAPRVAVVFAEVASRPHARIAIGFRHRHKDGGWRDFSSIATNLLHDAAVGGIVVNSQDVTEQRVLEAQLRQAQKMEAVGQLAGGIAHDFNNLLTVIGSYSEFVLADLPTDSRLRADVEEIRGAASRAANLTRQLLAFSRQQVLAPRVIDVGLVVRGMEDMLSRVLGADVHLRARLAPDVATCFADPGQLEQVLMNLVVNARDAMPDGGQLTIEVANVSVDAATAERRDRVAPGDYVMLAVSDTGVGMDEETRARIFEPFFTTKEVGQGTGLGLSTAYGIVKQSGGAITVYSVPGEGTTFKVFLPVRGELAEDAPGADAFDLRVSPLGAGHAGAVAEGAVVLVVDDEAWVRDVVDRTLVRHGFSVLQAINGPDALAIMEDRTQRVDLVISDMTMPVLRGTQLLQHLAELRPGTRAVLMSGFTADALLRRGTLPPGVAFLGKPFTQHSLLAAVAEALLAPSTRRTPVALPSMDAHARGTYASRPPRQDHRG